jgi:hypothetical protein
MEIHADPILAPQLTLAIQDRGSTGDSNMTISSCSNSQDAEEHVTDPSKDTSLTCINSMHVDELLDETPRPTQVDDNIMDYSNIIKGSEDMDRGDVMEGNDKVSRT